MNWKLVPESPDELDISKVYLCAFSRGRIHGISMCSLKDGNWFDMTMMHTIPYNEFQWCCEIEYPWESRNYCMAIAIGKKEGKT